MSKVVTQNEVRLSYMNLLEPRAQNDEKPDELTYSTAILIPKSDTATVDAIKAGIKAALAEGISKKWGGKAPNGLRNPLRDGDADRPDDETYKGMYFLNGKGPRAGKEPVILLNKNGAPTTSKDIIYSGVYARVSLQFYPYDVSGNKGVACGVTSVMSMEHGEPLGNTVTATSAAAEFGITTPVAAAASEFDAPKAKSITDLEAEEDDPWGE